MNITALQYNVHWECFVKNKDDCCQNIINDFIETTLSENKVDFANIIMLENNKVVSYGKKYTILNQFHNNPQMCSRDITTMIYNNTKWIPIGKTIYGCLVPGDKPDRSYIVQKFQSKSTKNFDVLVIGAHFSHDKDQSLSVLKDIISKNKWNTGNILLIADTNIDVKDVQEDKNIYIMDNLGLKLKVGSKYDKTCCYDEKGIVFTYDSILGNFGSKMTTNTLQLPNFPLNCSFETMHIPLLATIFVADNSKSPKSQLNDESEYISSSEVNYILIIVIILLIIIFMFMIAKLVKHT